MPSVSVRFRCEDVYSPSHVPPDYYSGSTLGIASVELIRGEGADRDHEPAVHVFLFYKMSKNEESAAEFGTLTE